MSRIQKAILAVVLVIIGSNCREPFEPDFETGVNDYLVVEGYINVGNKAVTTIKLSRVSPLGDAATPTMETDALVSIEASDESHYSLAETTEGIYSSDSLSLDPTQEYRLLISLTDGLSYASAFVQPVVTPAIDSIYWKWEDTGIHFYVNAHDNENHTKFYSWTYRETWQIKSPFQSKFKYVKGEVVFRAPAETADMWNCWRDNYPDDLMFGSTEQLSTDVITSDLVTLSHDSEQLRVRYSLLVSQRALEETEYRYLQLIQKNTNNTGSLFDAMPSEIIGNVTCTTSANVRAIGYVGASTTEMLRRFFLPSEIGIIPKAQCLQHLVVYDSIDDYFGGRSYIPIDSIPGEVITRPSYTGAPKFCMDCRLRGSPVKPDFW
jgi:hypothetical protein